MLNIFSMADSFPYIYRNAKKTLFLRHPLSLYCWHISKWYQDDNTVLGDLILQKLQIWDGKYDKYGSTQIICLHLPPFVRGMTYRSVLPTVSRRPMCPEFLTLAWRILTGCCLIYVVRYMLLGLCCVPHNVWVWRKIVLARELKWGKDYMITWSRVSHRAVQKSKRAVVINMLRKLK